MTTWNGWKIMERIMTTITPTMMTFTVNKNELIAVETQRFTKMPE